MSIKKIAKKTAKKVPIKKVTVKKATVKKVAKKTTPKKSVKKATGKTRSSKKDLIFANDQTSFWVKDGRILNSLIALRDALNEMEKEVYVYHATGEHNDFANWVEAVLRDSVCAKDLEKAKTPNSAKTIIVRHLKSYSV
ncbi:hypothetical protein KC865_03055 [Candidatus Kaiserbacteria bacterium]|nr:hypothetical protein [Candidatus Kaiserbacteria bacterium]USN91924.1 MAG: hypothetical protein H6782_03550 [Candidatus Nomurabacteria bacterium]